VKHFCNALSSRETERQAQAARSCGHNAEQIGGMCVMVLSMARSL
jgi:hypothetical protein